MIFVDPSGRRWARIKGGGAAATALVVLPAGAILAASFLYLPNTGGLSLPHPLTTIQEILSGDDSGTAAPTETPAAQPTAVKKTTAKTTSKPPTLVSKPTATTAAIAPLATTSTTTTAPSSTPTNQGTTNQPVSPGNSDYGKSHKN